MFGFSVTFLVPVLKTFMVVNPRFRLHCYVACASLSGWDLRIIVLEEKTIIKNDYLYHKMDLVTFESLYFHSLLQ